MLTVRPLHPDDLILLYEFWYDLAVLRSRLYCLPAEFPTQQQWIAQQRALSGWTALAALPVGALFWTQNEQVAAVQAVVIDLHTPLRQPIGAALWQHARAAWQQQGIVAAATTARHLLPVEAALWQACGAVEQQGLYRIAL